MLQVIRDACNILAEPGKTPGPSKLAELIGVSRQSLYMWTRVPAERVIAIEAATGGKIPRDRLRPDLYPPIPCNDNVATDKVNNTEGGSVLHTAPGV